MAKLDINTALQNELEQIPGIGGLHADAITHHREEAGPFQSLDQLDTLPHFADMDSKQRNALKAELEVRPETAGQPSGPKLNLNEASREELMRIEGIGEGRVDQIIRHREERGGFRDLSELDQLPHFREMPSEQRDAIRERLKIY